MKPFSVWVFNQNESYLGVEGGEDNHYFRTRNAQRMRRELVLFQTATCSKGIKIFFGDYDDKLTIHSSNVDIGKYNPDSRVLVMLSMWWDNKC